jgi:hypothetical protein
MAAPDAIYKRPDKRYWEMQSLFQHYTTGKGFALDSIRDVSAAVAEFCQTYKLMFKLVFDPVDMSWSGVFITEMGQMKARVISDPSMERAIVMSVCEVVNVLSEQGRLKP